MEVIENFPLKEITYYKIGGAAKYILKVQNKEDLQEALAFIAEKNITKILPVGLGANLLIHDTTFDGAILWFAKPKETLIQQDGNLITVFASHLLDDVIQFSFENNLVGLSWAGGLPSTVGAAVRGNVGCFGREIKQIVESVEVLDLENKSFTPKKLNKEELQFGYRTSFVKHNPSLIVVSVTFRLEKANAEQIEKTKEEYQTNIDYRNTNHPMEYPSCGSVFKNVVEKENVEKILSVWPDITETVMGKWHGKVAMGYINKHLGFSGFTRGGAQVSEKHGNYIVNKDNASFHDVFGIITDIKNKFEQTFGFVPEPEVQIVE